MLFNPRDQYVGRALDIYGEYSPDEAALFSALLRPGAVVLDIGAHVGAHTLVFARAVGPAGGVLSFEPQRPIFLCLCANVALNGFEHVYTYHAAVGAQAGEITVPRLDYAAEANFAGLELGAGGLAGEKTPVIAIDDLGLEQCHFVKIDVEGMELEVLRGAAQTLARHRPVLYVENDRPDRSRALIEHIEGLGYALYWHRPPMFSPHNANGRADNIFGEVVSVNMLGFHRALGATVTGLRPVAGPNDQGVPRAAEETS